MSKCPKDWGRNKISNRLTIDEKILFLFKRNHNIKIPIVN